MKKIKKILCIFLVVLMVTKDVYDNRDSLRLWASGAIKIPPKRAERILT